MTQDDVLFGYRLQLFDLAGRVCLSEACRTFGVHRSTNYTWKRQVDRHGLEMLRPRERRLNGFSTSTLPEVQLTIRSTSTCGTWKLFDAPVPRSSSVSNDIDPANLAGTASNDYRQLLTWPGEQLFF